MEQLVYQTTSVVEMNLTGVSILCKLQLEMEKLLQQQMHLQSWNQTQVLKNLVLGW